MSRLTKYRDDIQAYDYIELCGGISQAVTNKLGKLEDLEEQLGCPLEVIVKALEYGIYAKDLPREELSKQFVRLSNVETEWYLINMIMVVNLKDYKKTWWLKENREE